MTCVDSGHWNGADSATEKGERPKPLWRRREGYRTSEHGEGGDQAYMYAGENAGQLRKGKG